MTSSGYKGFLRDDNIAPNSDLVLIVDPDALANPTSITDTEFPRKLHARSGAKDYVSADVGTKQPQYLDPQSGTYLPRIGDEDEFHDRPEVNDYFGAAPRFTLSRRLR